MQPFKTSEIDQLQHDHERECIKDTMKTNNVSAAPHTASLHNLHFHWNVSTFDNQTLLSESQMPELSLYWTLECGNNLPPAAWFTEIHREMKVFMEQMVASWNVSTHHFELYDNWNGHMKQ